MPMRPMFSIPGSPSETLKTTQGSAAITSYTRGDTKKRNNNCFKQCCLVLIIK
jgi:hypothetical protein